MVRVALALALLVGATGCGSVSGSDSDDAEARSAPSSEVDAPEAGTTKALFFGDSYVVGGGYTEAEGSMAAIAARRLGWTYEIRGAGGTGFVSGNAEFGLPAYPEQIDQGALDVGEVDWLVVEGGSGDRGVAPAQVTEQAVLTLEEARRRHPEARLVLVTSMDPTVDDFSDTDGVTGALERAAERVGIPFVDTQRWLEGRPELVGPDYDHPLPRGHQVCGRKLAAALSGLG